MKNNDLIEILKKEVVFGDKKDITEVYQINKELVVYKYAEGFGRDFYHTFNLIEKKKLNIVSDKLDLQILSSLGNKYLGINNSFAEFASKMLNNLKL